MATKKVIKEEAKAVSIDFFCGNVKLHSKQSVNLPLVGDSVCIPNEARDMLLIHRVTDRTWVEDPKKPSKERLVIQLTLTKGEEVKLKGESDE